MKHRIDCVVVGFWALFLSLVPLTFAQTTIQTASALPRLVRFSGTAKDLNGNPMTGVVGITFAFYSEQTGGAPLWLETQNATADSNGHFTALLGSTKPDGLPSELFTSEQAHWVGVQVSGQAEQPRVLLVSAPYALKAGDAETIGGLPPSAFVLATRLANGKPTANAPADSTATVSASAGSKAGSISPATTSDVTTTGGKANYLPVFNGAATIIDSVVYQSGTGGTAKVGINTTTPASTLDVNGAATVRGAFNLPAQGTAIATAGYISHTLNLTASAFNSGSGKAINQAFRWQAEPAGNNTSSPSGTMNLLFAEGTSTPAETGVNIASNGEITGPIVNATTSFDLAGNPFAFGSESNGNAFVGFAGNFAMTGIDNTGGGVGTLASNTTGANNVGYGYQALYKNTGNDNTAIGEQALYHNTTGGDNTATGWGALFENTTGGDNTAFGDSALTNNTTGGDNTAVGWGALYFNSTGGGNTAIGYDALNENSSSNSTAVGWSALFSNQTGVDNTATGFAALYSNISGFGNTANGVDALYKNTESYNTAIGYGVLAQSTTGTYNTATGFNALTANITGTNNTTAGTYTLANNNSGSYDTAVGVSALALNTTGMENTAIGAFACQSNTTGNDLTCEGYDSAVIGSGLHNATAIGAHASVNVSDALVLGSVAGVNGAKATTRVGIGTTSPTNLLTLGKGAGASISDGWTTYSSRRWKTNIQTLPGALAKIEKLRGVSYDLKDSGKHEIGVIAEEVGTVVPEVVSYEQNGKDARGVDYSRLTALLIEATKEQQREIHRQQTALRTQAAAIRDLRSELRVTRQTLQKVKAQVVAAQPALVAEK